MRRRLALVALAVTAMVVIAFVVPLGLLVRDQARDRALARAQREAQSVASALSVAISLSPEGVATSSLAELVVTASAAESRISVVVPDGTVIGAPAVLDGNVERARAGAAFTATVAGGAEVLVPVSGRAGTWVVLAFVADEDLEQGVSTAWLVLGALGLGLVLLAVFVADRLGRSVVRPVGELATAAHRLGEGDLDARVTPGGPPEVAEVGEAFNHLARRLRDLLAAERESVADLSHRLRTPLAAVRLQAETLRDEHAAELLADLDRLQEAVDQLIVEARRPAQRAEEPADLGEVVRHRTTFWAVLAREQSRPMTVDVSDSPLPIALGREELGAAIDVLLENVFAHTPPGTPFSVEVTQGRAGPVLIVADRGPGPPDPGLLDRGASGSGSTGLGLDIVRRAAERAGGSFVVASNPGGGARMEVRFGN